MKFKKAGSDIAKVKSTMKILKVINVVDFCQNQLALGKSSFGQGIANSLNNESSHSALAMAAAKKMRRVRTTRSREKTGHIVCQHLLNMLAEDDHSAEQEVQGEFWQGLQLPKANNALQFSLSL